MQKSVYGKIGQESRKTNWTGSNAGVDKCPSSGLKDGKVTPSTFMSLQTNDFEQRTKYSFKKELPGLTKTANAYGNWDPKYEYKKNLDFGFVKLEGKDLTSFFRERGANRGTMYNKILKNDAYLSRKYGAQANLAFDPYFTSVEQWQHDICWKSKKPLNGHKSLKSNCPDDHFKRCDLALTDKIMQSHPSRQQARQYRQFYTNACSIMEDIPNSWKGNLSMDWLDNKKFKTIKRPQDLKKSLIMTGELFSPARCMGTDAKKFSKFTPSQVENKIFSACFQKARDQISVPSQSCEDGYEGLIQDWKQLEHLPLSFFEPKDQVGINVNVNLGVSQQTQSWLDDLSGRFVNGVTGIIGNTKELLTSTFSKENVIKGLSAFIVGSILVGLAVKYGCMMITKLFNLILSLIFGFKSQEVKVCQDQAGGVEGIFLGPMILMTSVFGVSSSLLKMKQLNEGLRVLSYLPRAESGVDTILEWMKQTYDSVDRLFQKFVCGVEVPLQGINHPVNEWLDSFEDIHKQWLNGSFTFDLTTYSLVHSLWVTGTKLMRSPAFKQDIPVIRMANSSLEKLLLEFRQKKVVAGAMRNPPVTILLYGGTNVGKSTCTMGLAASILHQIMPDIDVKRSWNNLVYARAAEQEYWDGYSSQPVCVFDDYGQGVDSAAAPNLEHFEIIRAANAFPYPLHMADITDKGATNFDSKIIICSSNLSIPKTESLNFPDALYRRFDICVEVTNNPKYLEKRPDHFVDDFYEFEMYTIDAKRKEKVPYAKVNWNGLVDQAVRIYKKRAGFVRTVDDFIMRKCEEQPQDRIVEATIDGVTISNEEIVKQRQADVERGLTEALDEMNTGDVSVVTQLPVTVKRRETIPISQLNTNEVYVPPQNETISQLNTEEVYVPPQNETRLQAYWRRFNRWRGNSLRLNDVFEDIGKVLSERKNKVYSYRTSVMNRLYEKFPFLANRETVIKFIRIFIIAPLVFFGCKRILRNRREYSEAVITESYSTINGKPVKTEYGEKSVRPAKTEYGEPSVKPTKTESYGEVQVKVAKVESVECKVALPQYDQLIANEAASQMAQRINSVVEQACIDQNAAEICTKVLTRNLYKISVDNSSLGHVLMIKGRVGLMPAHFLYFMEQKVKEQPTLEIVFRSVFSNRVFSLLLSDFLGLCNRYETPLEPGMQSKDICHFSLYKNCAVTHPDITKLFCSSLDLSYLKNSFCCLPTLSCPLNSQPFAKVKCTTTGQMVKTEDIETSTPGFNNRRLIRQCWAYKLDSEEGDCGAPLVLRNPQLQPGKLVGIHIAGREGGFGYSTPLYSHDIEKILSYHTPASKITDQICSVRLPKGHIIDQPSFRPMDKIVVQVSEPSKTVIQPSPIYGKLQEPLTKPCQLREKDGFDPWKYRLDLFGSEGVVVNQKMIDNSVEALVHHVHTAVLKQGDISEKPVYSYEEAVEGIVGESYLTSLKRNSSPGFPFVTSKQFATKEKFFGKGPDWDFENPKNKALKDRCLSIIEKAKAGERDIHVFIDTLKDERKPIAKAHKTRMFSACPLDYLLCCKMYMMGLVSSVTKVRNFTGIAIGTNVYSDDWDHLAHLLLNKSDEMVAGDFAGFDSSQVYQLLRAACDALIKLYCKIFENVTPEDVLVLQVLLESLVSSVHLCKGNIYQALKNLPSGHFLTAFINTFFVFLVFCCAWQIAFGISLTSAFKFFEECGLIGYGDDHVVSIPKKYLFKFNQFTLIKIFEQLNMKYTLEDKEAEVTSPSRKISEVTFLKRKFNFDPRVNRYIAPLSMDTILESPMWIKKCVDPVAQTVVELENSLRELSLYPEETWEQYIDRFENAFKILKKTSVYLHRAIAFENVQKVWERSVFDQANCLVNNERIVATQMTSVGIYHYVPGSLVAAPYYPGRQDSVEELKCALDLKDTLANTQNSEMEKDLTSMSNPTSTLASEVNESAQVRQEITAFADDKAVINQDLPMVTNLPKYLRTDFHDDREHSVISFLKRPRIVQTVQWLAQPTNTELVSFDIPTGVLSEMQRNKLDGFTSFRASCVIRIQVNAQPFQCGRLIAQVIPIPGLLGDDRVNECRRALDKRVVMNGVQMDISKQSEVTINIPYVSPFSAYDLISGKYEWARFILSVYSPLNQVSAVPLQVNIWAYFEDVEMGYPTLSAQYVPAQDQVKLNTVQDVAKGIEGHGFITQAVGVLDQVVQSGADIIGGFVPSMKPIVNPIAKVTDAAYDIFKAGADALSFIPGLSKPEPAFHGKTVLFRPTQNFGTGDGVDHGHKLAMHNINRLDFIKSWAGSEMDELSFDYLKRMPNYISGFNYTNNTTYGTVLWSTCISPTYRSAPVNIQVGRQGDSGTVTIPTPTTLQYICGPFQQWRGSLVYTFKFVKTDYHSGRVEICFVPFAGAANTAAQTTRYDYVYKIIVDLREQTEVSFKVDYTSVTPYKFLNHSVNPITYLGTWDQIKAWSTGMLIVRAITPLQLGSNIVSSGIECLIEVKAGDDFEVTVPVKQSFAPIINTNTTLPTQATDQIYASAGSKDLRSEYIERKIDSESITGISTNTPKISAGKALACVGESFGNFRTFLKRFSWYQYKTSYFYLAFNDFRAPSLSTGVIASGQYEQPFLQLTTSNSVSQGLDPMCYIANMYAFFRGGVRYKFAIFHQGNDSGPRQLVKASILGTYPQVQPQPQFLSANAYELSNKGIWEFSMPFNSPTPMAPVTYIENRDPKIEDTVASATAMIFSNGQNLNDTQMCIARAAADDFDLGYFIGAPLALNLDAIPFRTNGSDEDDFGTSDVGQGFRLNSLAFDPVASLVNELRAQN